MGVIYTRNNDAGLVDLIEPNQFDGCETVDITDIEDWESGLLSAKYVIVGGKIKLNEQDE